MTVHESARAGPGARVQQRSSIFLAAVLRAGAEQVPVKVRNMSTNGAMIESPLTPPLGTKVQLVRGVLIAEGKIVWTSTNHCGLQFTTKLLIKEWLAPLKLAEQQRVDSIVSLVRAGAIPTAFTVPGNPNAASTSRPQNQLLDALEDVCRLMQDLEDNLASSPETLARHGEKLQNLDIAKQVIRAIAYEMTASRDGVDSRDTSLEDLRIVCAQVLAEA